MRKKELNVATIFLNNSKHVNILIRDEFSSENFARNLFNSLKPLTAKQSTLTFYLKSLPFSRNKKIFQINEKLTLYWIKLRFKRDVNLIVWVTNPKYFLIHNILKWKTFAFSPGKNQRQKPNSYLLKISNQLIKTDRVIVYFSNQFNQREVKWIKRGKELLTDKKILIFLKKNSTIF